MLLDVSFFTTGPRRVLNAFADEVTTDVPRPHYQAVQEFVEGYIERYEPMFLRQVVGDELAAMLEDYGESKAEGGDGFVEDQEYEYLLTWLLEPMADYVMYKILRDAGQDVTVTGAVKVDTDNVYVDAATRQVTVWNEMVEELRAFVDSSIGRGMPVARNLLTPINTLNL